MSALLMQKSLELLVSVEVENVCRKLCRTVKNLYNLLYWCSAWQRVFCC